MADIELVVKLPESIWVAIQNGEYCGISDDRTYNAIKNGTLLPKGHGDSIDDVLDKIKRDIFDACSDNYHMPVYKLDCDTIFEIIDKYQEKSAE